MKSQLKLTTLILALILTLAACNLPLGTSAPEPAPAQLEGEAQSCTNQAAMLQELTIPTGSLIAPGSQINKTWRIQNTGTCPWSTAYTWEQINFENTSLKTARQAAPLVAPIAPGESLDISVELALDASSALGDSQIAKFRLRSPEGDLFGDLAYALVFASTGTGVCPVGTSQQATFVNPVLGFCFLYPAGHEIHSGETGAMILQSPAASGPSEEALPTISISSQGDAGGLNSADWAGEMVKAWAAPGSTANVETLSIGGVEAYQTDNLPGRIGNRNIFVVHNGHGLVFNLMPVDDAFPAQKEAALQLWEMVRSSLVFFTP